MKKHFSRYLWCGFATFVLYLIWNLGHVAASKNNLPLKGTWLGMAYIIVGLLLILTGLYFWIMGIRAYSLESEEEPEKEEDKAETEIS